MKFDLFTDKIGLRYDTLEKNIKSKSNSFFDAYLDLLEETVKYILLETNIEFNASRTCGAILKEEKVKKLFLEKIKLDHHTYDKLFDYIKKCNDHKHKKEKWVGKDSIINYLNIYFDFVNAYKSFIGNEAIVFDEKYFDTIFNETEKVNNEILEKLEIQDEKIEEIFNILKNEKTVKDESQKKKEEVENQIEVNNFLQTSKKINFWVGTKQEFKKTKIKAIISGVISILLGIVTPAVSSGALLMESFSIFTLVWMAMTIFLTAYVIRLEKETENGKLVDNTFEKYEYYPQIRAYINTSKEKKKFLICRIFTYILIVLDVICLISEFKGVWSVIALILEVLYFASIIVYRKYLVNFYIGYDIKMKYEGVNRLGRKVIVMYDLIIKDFYNEK